MAVKAGGPDARARLARLTANAASRGQHHFAMAQPQRGRVVRGSKLVRVKDRKGAAGGAKAPTSDRVWQAQAYEFNDTIGELGFITNLKANTVSQCDLTPQWRDDNGDWVDPPEPGATGDDTAADGKVPAGIGDKIARVMEAFVGPIGGLDELMRRGAVHLEVAGESHLVGIEETDEGVSLGVLWEFLSTSELQLNQDGRYTRRRDGGSPTDLAEQTYVARMHRPHPQYSDLADSEVRRVITVCQEIVVLTQMIDAVAKSRLPAGILFIPDEMSFASEDHEDTDTQSSDDVEEDDGIDEFIEEFFHHVSAPIEDRAAAEGYLPLIMRGPGELGDKVRLIELARAGDEWADRLRDKAISRMLAGIDAPKELIDKGSLTHWTSYNIDAEFAVKHVRPIGDMIADFVSDAYLRKMLQDYEGLSAEEAARCRVVFDMSAVMAREDEAAAARVLFELGAINEETLRKANGFDEASKPTEKERTSRIALDLIKANPAIFAVAMINLVEGFETFPAENLGEPSNPYNGQGGGGGRPSNLASVEDELNPPDATSGMDAPERNPDGDDASPVPTMQSVVDRLAVSADAALERAFEVAGSRVVTRCQKFPELKAKVNAVPKNRAATVLEAGDLSKVGAAPGLLFHQAWDGFNTKATEWLTGYLVAKGRRPLDANETAARAASDMVGMLEAFAGDHLHKGLPVTGSNGLMLPNRLIVAVLHRHGM